MKAMVLNKLSRLSDDSRPLALTELPVPVPGSGEVRIKVAACGVCHTELDEVEGRTVPPSLPVVPGHEVIGYVDKLGTNVDQLKPGDRVGVGWIHSSCGGEHENININFKATGRDVDGGYAEYMVVPEQYAYRIPKAFSSIEAAPLLCAGAVGYRALKLTQMQDGQSLGLTGFGGSAHLVLQAMQHLFPGNPIYVFARDETARNFALKLGATWAGNTTDRAPQLLDAIIDTTPAWLPVVEALSNLAPGGRLVINAIRKEERDKHFLQKLNYHEHLWMEKEIKTVANVTRHDIAEFLNIAAAIPIKPQIETYPLEAANQALVDLKFNPVIGAKVLTFFDS